MTTPTGSRPAPLMLYPAIDIRDGRAVRLVQGDYDRETRYDDDPLTAAQRWVDGGASILHVVDLDGARSGEPANLDVIARIADAVDVPIQVGGGLRDRRAVEQAFASGAQRAVLGTSAQRNPDLLGELAELYPGPDRRLRRRPRRPGRRRGLGEADRHPGPGGDRAARLARGLDLPLHAGRGRRDPRRPRHLRPRADPEGVRRRRRRAHLLGRGRHPEGSRGPGEDATRPASPA